MNELLKINYEAEQPTVSARDLHEALEINTRFNDWFSRMAEYGFENGVDFNLLKNEKVRLEGNREVKRDRYYGLPDFRRHGKTDLYDPAIRERQAVPSILH